MKRSQSKALAIAGVLVILRLLRHLRAHVPNAEVDPADFTDHELLGHLADICCNLTNYELLDQLVDLLVFLDHLFCHYERVGLQEDHDQDLDELVDDLTIVQLLQRQRSYLQQAEEWQVLAVEDVLRGVALSCRVRIPRRSQLARRLVPRSSLVTGSFGIWEAGDLNLIHMGCVVLLFECMILNVHLVLVHVLEIQLMDYLWLNISVVYFLACVDNKVAIDRVLAAVVATAHVQSAAGRETGAKDFGTGERP